MLWRVKLAQRHTHTHGGLGALSGELHRMTCPTKSAPYDSKNPCRLCSIMDHAQIKYIHKQIVPFILRSNAPNKTQNDKFSTNMQLHSSLVNGRKTHSWLCSSAGNDLIQALGKLLRDRRVLPRSCDTGSFCPEKPLRQTWVCRREG